MKPRSPSPVRTTLREIRVRATVADRRRGHLLVGTAVIPCALGACGIVSSKREGDGGSPRGTFRLRGGGYRPDHLPVRPRTALPIRPIRRDDGWCDDRRDRRYNQPMRLPAPGVSAEAMWRGDGLYDVVLDIDYNRAPIRKGRGSAIFMHIARDGYRPTEGCVALARRDLLKLLVRLGPRTVLRIG
ncbi:MAG: L,D-transpeptidase family protein [Parafilimonas terrae]|nr:L,D-transpeptidase family protein [Parafilimonas terrae]